MTKAGASAPDGCPTHRLRQDLLAKSTDFEIVPMVRSQRFSLSLAATCPSRPASAVPGPEIIRSGKGAPPTTQ